jgi:hypothetical protein
MIGAGKAQSTRGQVRRHTNDIWRSLDHKTYGGKPLTIATLFDRAMSNGYKPHIETIRILPEIKKISLQKTTS